jgi:hypothetical protein
MEEFGKKSLGAGGQKITADFRGLKEGFEPLMNANKSNFISAISVY